MSVTNRGAQRVAYDRHKYLGAPTEVRFFAKADRSGGPDACWPWSAGKDKDGYGTFQWGGKQRAPRVAYRLHHGRWPNGVVRHTCDNPARVNAAHLIDGSDADNVEDRVARGRNATTGSTRFGVGEAHFKARLTREDVLALRRRFPSITRAQSRIVAVELDVSQDNIRSIIGRGSWKGVEP